MDIIKMDAVAKVARTETAFSTLSKSLYNSGLNLSAQTAATTVHSPGGGGGGEGGEGRLSAFTTIQPSSQHGSVSGSSSSSGGGGGRLNIKAHTELDLNTLHIQRQQLSIETLRSHSSGGTGATLPIYPSSMLPAFSDLHLAQGLPGICEYD